MQDSSVCAVDFHLLTSALACVPSSHTASLAHHTLTGTIHGGDVQRHGFHLCKSEYVSVRSRHHQQVSADGAPIATRPAIRWGRAWASACNLAHLMQGADEQVVSCQPVLCGSLPVRPPAAPGAKPAVWRHRLVRLGQELGRPNVLCHPSVLCSIGAVAMGRSTQPGLVHHHPASLPWASDQPPQLDRWLEAHRCRIFHLLRPHHPACAGLPGEA